MPSLLSCTCHKPYSPYITSTLAPPVVISCPLVSTAWTMAFIQKSFPDGNFNWIVHWLGSIRGLLSADANFGPLVFLLCNLFKFSSSKYSLWLTSTRVPCDHASSHKWCINSWIWVKAEWWLSVNKNSVLSDLVWGSAAFSSSLSLSAIWWCDVSSCVGWFISQALSANSQALVIWSLRLSIDSSSDCQPFIFCFT